MSRLDAVVSSYLDKREILYRTNQGVDIIRRYVDLKRRGRKMVGLCCFHSERTGSFNVNPDTGTYVCYGCGETGNAVDLIMKKMGLEFQDALEYIANDFHLELSIPVSLPKAESKIYEKLKIDFSDKPFTCQHHQYMNAGHLQEDFLRTLNIFAVDKWAINGKIQTFKHGQYSFAYYDEQNDIVKILSLNVPKADKWRNNAPRGYLWWLPTEPTENLFIEKSNKDGAVGKLLGYNECAVNSENAENLIENMPRILEVCPNPIISFGSDPIDDAKADRVIQAYPQVRKFTMPKSLLKFDVNDKFSYSAEFGLKATKALIDKQLQ